MSRIGSLVWPGDSEETEIAPFLEWTVDAPNADSAATTRGRPLDTPFRNSDFAFMKQGEVRKQAPIERSVQNIGLGGICLSQYQSLLPIIC